MSIESQTKKIMKDAIERYASENEVTKERIQLLIFTDNPDLVPRYKVLKDNKELKQVTFNEILNTVLNIFVYLYLLAEWFPQMEEPRHGSGNYT